MEIQTSPSISNCKSACSNSRRISPRSSTSSVYSQPLPVRGDRTIREGNDFQAPVEDLDSVSSVKAPTDAVSADEYPDRDICVWRSPSRTKQANISDEMLISFCELANQNFGVGMEQALYLLYSTDYDVDEAKNQLVKYVAIPTKFSEQDLDTFRFAYSCCGKNFRKIQQMMSHKSLTALVQHYYDTKKHHLYKKTIDVENPGLTSDHSESELANEREDKDENGLSVCENCKALVSAVTSVNELDLCTKCRLYFLATNRHRQCRMTDRHKRQIRCPAGMQKFVANFVYFASASQANDFKDADESGELQIACERETRCEVAIRDKRREISKMRAEALCAEAKAAQEYKGIENFMSSTDYQDARAFIERTMPPKARLQYSWQDTEKMTALHALVTNGYNFSATAEMLGTKSADMVKSFYTEECHGEDIEMDEEEESMNDGVAETQNIDFSQEFKKLVPTPEVIDID